MTRNSRAASLRIALVAVTSVAAASTAHAAVPVVSPGYSLSVFATAPMGSSAPDSIDVNGNSVFIGYGNGVASDGSDGKSSTIVQYTMAGTFVQAFTVPGHNDGLRVNPVTHQLWAVENEDGNSQLVVIDPATAKQTIYNFANPAAHGGGYDDIQFLKGQTFVSASSPTLDKNGVNVSQAIVQISLNGSSVVATPVLLGNANATVKPGGAAVQLNLTDPDSMTVDPTGALVLDDQSDNQLAIVHNPGSNLQTVEQLNLMGAKPVNVDDTQFLSASKGTLLISDRNSNTIYGLTSDSFAAGQAFSANPTDNILSKLDYSSGIESPIITGLDSPHGLGFIPAAVPLPAASWTVLMGLAGIAGVVAMARRRGMKLSQ